MLTTVRKTLKTAAAWVFVSVMILAFALWQVPEIRQFSGAGAITVGDQSFSQNYVQSEFTRAMQSQRLETGRDLTREEALALGLHHQVVSQIATTSAINQFSRKMRLLAPREIIRDFLHSNENFRNPATGQFDQSVLESILRQNGISAAEFERRISEDIQRNQLINALASGAPAPEPLVEAMLLREFEQRRIRYLTVTDDMAGRAQEPTPDDLMTFYEQRASDFTAPEYRTFDLLILRDEDFHADAAAPEEALRKIYEIRKEREFDQPERRTLYQITYDSEPEALAAAAALRQGAPFEQIASERGLSLDAVTFAEAQKRDILDPAVAEAVFDEAVREGGVPDPVQGVFGWTVAQIAGIIPAQLSTFEDKRDEIKAQYLQDDARRALNDAVDEIELARDAGADLAAAAEAAGFSVETFGPVDRLSFAPGGAIVDRVPGEALAEAFLLNEGDESEPLALAEKDGYFLVSMREIIPPARKSFEEVRDNVEQQWRKEERRARISETVGRIRERAARGDALDAVAREFDRAPTELTIDRRFNNEAISSVLVEEIFAAAPGELVSGPAAFGEAQVVAEIVQIGSTRARIPPDQAERYAQYVGYQLDQELLDAFLAGLREDYDVTVNQARIDALFSEGS
jgi:peptidyl-prolyl cis-trans isomerase D